MNQLEPHKRLKARLTSSGAACGILTIQCCRKGRDRSTPPVFISCYAVSGSRHDLNELDKGPLWLFLVMSIRPG